jgi:tyrosyl-tRNA synthetase
MTLSEELNWRGFVNQTTYKKISDIDTKPISFYWGVDPSADSMTVGNLAIAVMIRHFIEHGHHAYLLVGGATGIIGDPDTKDEERNLKSLEEIEHNKTAIVKQYNRLFAGQPYDVVDNYDWFKDVGYLDFLRNIGKHVPMRQMLGREFIQKRISETGSGISYAEFSYALMQGYDFLHLFQEKQVTLQVCGADQWGNCIAGVELIRRIAGSEAHIWSAPLIVNTSTGVKFGKSETGAVWLDEQKTSVYQFYQFWLNIEDDSVERFLKMYTLLNKEKIEQIIDQFKKNRSERLAQKTLAYEVTKLVHGEEKANAVRKTTDVLFGSGNFSELSTSDIDSLKKELTVVKSTANDNLTALLVKSKMAESNTEASRLLNQGAVTLNGQKVSFDNQPSLHPGNHLLKRGKNNFAILEIDHD